MKDLYSYLGSYGLNERGKAQKRLARFSEQKLTTFLQDYLDLARKRPIVKRADPGVLDIFPDSYSDPLPLQMTRALAIYAGRIYFHDPLIGHAYRWPGLDFVPPVMMKYRTREDRVAFFRNELAATIEQILELAPLIQAGIVFLAPTELLQDRKNPQSIHADDFYGPGDDIKLRTESIKRELPSPIREYFEGHLNALPATYIDGEPALIPEELSPRNMIAITLDGDPGFHFFHLHQFDVIDEESHKVLAHFDPSDQQSKDPDTFWNWVEGEVYKVARARFKRLNMDLVASAAAGARFVTDLPASRDIAGMDLGAQNDRVAQRLVTALLNLRLPFFDNVELSAIVEARKNELAFEEFRLALGDALKQARSTEDSVEFQRELDEISQDLLRLPMERVEQEMNNLKRNLRISTAIPIGLLTATLISQGNTVISAALILSAVEALKQYKQDKVQEDRIKQMPGFFYWQLVHDAKH